MSRRGNTPRAPHAATVHSAASVPVRMWRAPLPTRNLPTQAPTPRVPWRRVRSSNGVLQPPKILRCERQRQRPGFNESLLSYGELASPGADGAETARVLARPTAHAHGEAAHPACLGPAATSKLERWQAACPARKHAHGDTAGGGASDASIVAALDEPGWARGTGPSGARLAGSPPLRDATGQHRFFASEATKKARHTPAA